MPPKKRGSLSEALLLSPPTRRRRSGLEHSRDNLYPGVPPLADALGPDGRIREERLMGFSNEVCAGSRHQRAASQVGGLPERALSAPAAPAAPAARARRGCGRLWRTRCRTSFCT